LASIFLGENNEEVHVPQMDAISEAELTWKDTDTKNFPQWYQVSYRNSCH
jgi:hypothetical protein